MRQGLHQLAQKSINTILFFKEDNLIVLPSIPACSMAGAVSPMFNPTSLLFDFLSGPGFNDPLITKPLQMRTSTIERVIMLLRFIQQISCNKQRYPKMIPTQGDRRF